MIWTLLRELEVLLGRLVRSLVTALRATARVVGAVWDRIELRAVAWFAIGLVALRSLFTRKRMSHDNGTAARVTIRLSDDVDLPDDEFFVPGRTFVGRCRFASISYYDDARLVGRGASLKFADERKRSPLDLLMNTGRSCPFNDIRSFWKFMVVTIQGRAAYGVPYMRLDPRYYVSSKDLLRAVPESFADLTFYSKVPMTLRGRDRELHYVKFRMRPAGGGTDDGRPTEQDLLDWAWCWQGVRPGETRGRNYLKEELRRRVAERKPRFALEAQVLEAREDQRRDVLDAGIAWDEETVPWRPVAEVTVEDALPYEESNRTLFTIRNRPTSMGVVAPRSIDDPAGMNYLRELGVWARRARLLGNRLFGMPKPFPDERPADTPHTPFVHPAFEGPRKPLSLPQHDGPAERSARREEIKRTRETYPLAVPGDLPTYAASLPERETFDGAERLRMWDDISLTIAGLGLAGIERLADRKKTLDKFDDFYPFRPIPAVHRRWRSDVEFARQRLIGVNPTMIERCDELPEKFPVREEDVADLLPDGTTLRREMDAGRVYLSDYAILDGVKTADVCYMPAPLCLFHAPEDGPLLPLAIQLAQDPSEGPVFTPNDPPWLWLTVKTYAQCADAAVHEITAHLLRTHLIMETVYLGARRQLSERHPLMELLAPHFRFTLAINEAARKDMLVPGGPLPMTMAAGYDGSVELLKRAFAEYRFDRYELRADLAARGVDGVDAAGSPLLGDYLYRDDALALHGAIDEYVRAIVHHFYANDDDVRNDRELAAWLAELADPARGNLRGLPGDGRIGTRDELVRFVAQIVFHASAEHCAVNNGQYEYFGYVPNVPGAMHKPPPTTKDELSEEWLVEALPDGERCSIQIAMVHLLSEPAEWPLGEVPEGFFQGHRAVLDAAHRLHDRLEHVSWRIRSRNALRDVPYTFLDPRAVSRSIVI